MRWKDKAQIHTLLTADIMFSDATQTVTHRSLQVAGHSELIEKNSSLGNLRPRRPTRTPEPPKRYSCRQIESFNIITSFQETCVFSFQIICLLGCQCNPKQERSELPLAATTSYKYIPGNTKMKLTLVYNGYCDTFSSMKLDWQGSQEPNRHLA